VADSIAPIARLLADHPEGIDPGGFPAREIAAASRDVRPITGRQGTVIWAHPFLVHSASVNATDRLRVISNTTAILRRPPVFSGGGPRPPIARAVLDALGVDALDFTPTRERVRLTPERERRWREASAGQSSG
jgi:hypothetical protein